MKLATRQEFSYVNRYKVKHFFPVVTLVNCELLMGWRGVKEVDEEKKDFDPLNRSRAYVQV